MPADLVHRGKIPEANLLVAIARTSEACRSAQGLHELKSGSAIALGRLLSAAAICGLSQKRPGLLSLQVMCEGRLQQVFADITDAGNLRGYIKNGDFAPPRLPGEEPLQRRSIAVGVGKGVLSVIRESEQEEFTQSTTDLVSGEIDADVSHFMETSDQRQTRLVCDVLLDADDHVALAGGIMVQGMPGADQDRFTALCQSLSGDAFARELQNASDDMSAVLKTLIPDAVLVDEPQRVQWKCRCSFDRVTAALHMLDALQLAEMVAEKRSAKVTCEFCGKEYEVPADDVSAIYQTKVKAQS